MKTIKFYILLLVTIFFSCQKDNNSVAQQADTSEVNTNQKSFFNVMQELDYKEDFIIPPDENGKPRNSKSTKEEWNLMKASGSHDVQQLAQSFPFAKTKIEHLYQNNETDKYTATIQLACLKYLRRYLLIQDKSEPYQEKVLDLLDMLIKTKSADLDVLVDAYLYSESIMLDDQKGDYYEYISQLYSQDMKYVEEKAPEFMKAIDESSGSEKKKYILWAKNLERMSLACLHARNGLPQLNSNN